MKKQKLNDILYLLHQQRDFDFSRYHESMPERRIQKRVFAKEGYQFIIDPVSVLTEIESLLKN